MIYCEGYKPRKNYVTKLITRVTMYKEQFDEMSEQEFRNI